MKTLISGTFLTICVILHILLAGYTVLLSSVICGTAGTVITFLSLPISSVFWFFVNGFFFPGFFSPYHLFFVITLLFSGLTLFIMSTVNN